MEERNELHVVVGGSGATGRVVARELAVRGSGSALSTAAVARPSPRGSRCSPPT